MCKAHENAKGSAYTIGETGANVNGFHKYFVKFSHRRRANHTKFRPASIRLWSIRGVDGKVQGLAGNKGRGVGHTDLLPGGGHHADQLNVACTLRGMAEAVVKLSVVLSYSWT